MGQVAAGLEGLHGLRIEHKIGRKHIACGEPEHRPQPRQRAAKIRALRKSMKLIAARACPASARGRKRLKKASLICAPSPAVLSTTCPPPLAVPPGATAAAAGLAPAAEVWGRCRSASACVPPGLRPATGRAPSVVGGTHAATPLACAAIHSRGLEQGQQRVLSAHVPWPNGRRRNCTHIQRYRALLGPGEHAQMRSAIKTVAFTPPEPYAMAENS